MGLVLGVAVHPADVQDRDGAKLVLERLQGRLPRLKLLWADGAYAGKLEEWARNVGDWRLELVRRQPGQHTFVVLPRRWVVERTFAWLGRCRRLSKDYEELPETTEAWIYSAMTDVEAVSTCPYFLDTLLGGGRDGGGGGLRELGQGQGLFVANLSDGSIAVNSPKAL